MCLIHVDTHRGEVALREEWVAGRERDESRSQALPHGQRVTTGAEPDQEPSRFGVL